MRATVTREARVMISMKVMAENHSLFRRTSARDSSTILKNCRR
jgi:hypothetical protein